MTSVLFCSLCYDNNWLCNREMDCLWRNRVKSNCSQICNSSFGSYHPVPCDCNIARNMTSEGDGDVCYHKYGKFLVLFYFCKHHNHFFKIKQKQVCFENFFNCNLKNIFRK